MISSAVYILQKHVGSGDVQMKMYLAAEFWGREKRGKRGVVREERRAGKGK